MRLLLSLSGILLLHIPSAFAVVVAGAGPNTSAPANDPGFSSVGAVNGASAVYLGNLWVISAAHTGVSTGGSVFFDSVGYTVTGPVIQLTNNGDPGMSALTDLIIFQINADPGLPALSISANSAPLDVDLMLIGNGQDREPGRSYWQVTAQPGNNDDVWMEVAVGDPHNVEGFKTASSGAGLKRWGTNEVAGTGFNVSDSFGTVRSLATVFDDGLPDEAQASVGDSGGAVFYQNGGQWELTGLMFAVGGIGNPFGFDNVPSGVSAFGQSVTFAADLSFYRGQINAATGVPEPGAAGLLAAAASLLLTKRRRSADGVCKLER